MKKPRPRSRLTIDSSFIKGVLALTAPNLDNAQHHQTGYPAPARHPATKVHTLASREVTGEHGHLDTDLGRLSLLGEAMSVQLSASPRLQDMGGCKLPD